MATHKEALRLAYDVFCGMSMDDEYSDMEAALRAYLDAMDAVIVPKSATEEALTKACEAFSRTYAVYPDGQSKAAITDWFELDAMDAVAFGVLKDPKWSYHSDIRSDEYQDYVAAVIREPMLSALSAMLAAAPNPFKDEDNE